MTGNNQIQIKKEQGLKKSLKFIYVYAIATGAIFTFIGYWDSVFYEYCGPGTFLAFLLMTALILPIAFVYCEMAPLFPFCGGELIYNTVGMNKHVGFLSAWLIMAAWIAVPPAAVMAIVQWGFKVFGIQNNFLMIEIIAAICLILYFFISLQSIEVAGKVQLIMLICAIVGCLITSIAFIFSSQWSLVNFKDFFYSQCSTQFNIPGWVVGLGLLITPFFGFETVPQLLEESDFPVKDSTKAIWGSILTCGIIYAIFFFGIGGMPVKHLVEDGGAARSGFLAIVTMENMGGIGWKIWSVIFGIAAILCAIGTCLLGFWLSTVRLLYAMGKQNFLPKSFAKLNKHQQPIIPNILLLLVSLGFLVMQNAGTFMNDFFNLMAFGCAVCYAITMISAMRIHKKYPNWVSSYHLKGGQFTRIIALIISIVIAFFCTLGQGSGSWKSFAIYLLIGVVLWLWMVCFKWKTTKVVITTPDGDKEY